MKKRIICAALCITVIGMALAGCQSKDSSSGTGSSDSGSTASASYTIGISQFAEHESLDNCRTGFLEGLAEEGIVEGENLTVDYKNAASDMGTAGQIADNFAADNVDLICGIATPSAQTAFNSAMSKEIPVIFTAVTDPVAAELAAEDGTPAGEITGTSDTLPVDAQLKMIREMLPDAKTIGIIYTTSEANSVSTIEEYKAKVADYDFTLETVGITNTSEISLAADDLLSKVDCISNLTDNTVVNSLPTILDKAAAKQIPVFGSEVEQVKIGCLAAEGIDYLALGIQTGKMAAQVLKGEKKASEIPYETISESGFYVNLAVADTLGITVPEDLLAEAVESFDTVAE
ncbi:MAG: ABC transporter substrate-binding protein [Lachnospiraceae bacterium]